jgi:hypothetical protein
VLGRWLFCAGALSASLAAAQPPGTDLYLAPLTGSGASLAAGAAAPLAPEPGYDNQPFFLDDDRLLFTSDRAGEATEIFRIDLPGAAVVRLTDTTEAEYSPTPLPSGEGFSVVRVEADGTQRLWSFDASGANPRLLLPDVRPVGYHAWIDRDRVALFVLGSPSSLQVASLASGKAERLREGIHRALHRSPTGGVSFVAVRAGAEDQQRWVHRLDPATLESTPLAPSLLAEGEHDLAWAPDGTLLMARGSVLHAWAPGASAWRAVRDFGPNGVAAITRLAVSPSGGRLVLVAADAPAPGPAERAAAGRALLPQAQAAGERGEWTAARRLLERAARSLPAQRGVTRRVAGALAREGRPDEALRHLRRLVEWRAPVDLVADPNFESLRGDARFQALSRDLAASLAPIARASPAVRFDGSFADFIPEGVAHDPSSERLFVGSVRRGVVVVIEEGVARPFADLGAAGHGRSVLGIATDPGRGLLWATVAGLPQGADLPAAERGRTALCAVALATGRIVRCVTPPAGPGEHSFNDLVVTAGGAIYVSDPGAATLYRLAPDARALEVVAGRADLESPNGLALSAREDALYIADYSLGLLRLDLATPGARPRRLETPGASLVGIDGLVRWRTSLLAIQNGIPPPRILKLALSEDGAAIAGVETLEIANPEWDEPTLGVVVRGEFVYVANSHWPRFAADGSLPDAASLSPPVLMRLRPGGL